MYSMLRTGDSSILHSWHLLNMQISVLSLQKNELCEELDMLMTLIMVII